MTRGSHALWATGLIIASVSVAGCKHRCRNQAPCDPFAAQYAPVAAPVLPGCDAGTPQPVLSDSGMTSDYQMYSQDMQGYPAQTYPTQTYPAQTYPAQTYPAPQTYNVPQTSPQPYPQGGNGYSAPQTMPGPTPTPALRPQTSPGYQYQQQYQQYQQYQQPRTYPAQPQQNGNYQPQSYRPSQYRRYQPQPGSYHAPAVTPTVPPTTNTVKPSAPIQAAPPIQSAPAIQAPGNAMPADVDAGDVDYRSTAAPAGSYHAQVETRQARSMEMMATADDHLPHVSRHYKVPATQRSSAGQAGAVSRPLPQDPIPLPSR